MWRGPGFVDSHSHLLWNSTGGASTYPQSVEEVRKYHQQLYSRGTNPVDDYVEIIPPDVDECYRGALDEAHALGIVAIDSMVMTNWETWDSLVRLHQQGLIPLKLRIWTSSRIFNASRVSTSPGSDLTIAGVKFYIDGWLTTRTAAINEPYEDDNQCGILFVSRDDLARQIDPIAEKGFGVACHAMGDLAIETVLDAYEKVFGSDCKNQLARIEHCSFVNRDLISRIAEIGVNVCLQPTFAASEYEDLVVALGARSAKAYCWSEMHKAGVQLISGSDFPIEQSQDPIVGLNELVNSGPEHSRLSMEEALTVMTKNGDDIMFSDDPYQIDSSQISDLKVVNQ